MRSVRWLFVIGIMLAIVGFLIAFFYGERGTGRTIFLFGFVLSVISGLAMMFAEGSIGDALGRFSIFLIAGGFAIALVGMIVFSDLLGLGHLGEGVFLAGLAMMVVGIFKVLFRLMKA